MKFIKYFNWNIMKRYILKFVGCSKLRLKEEFIVLNEYIKNKIKKVLILIRIVN